AVFVFLCRIAERVRLFLAKKVGDAIARDAEEPPRDVFDGHQQAVGFDEFVEDLLNDVFGVRGIGHTTADEIAKAAALLHDDLGDSAILLGHRGGAHGPVHPAVKTDEGRGYCRDLCTRDTNKSQPTVAPPPRRRRYKWVAAIGCLLARLG